jgi:hypothetical protein
VTPDQIKHFLPRASKALIELNVSSPCDLPREIIEATAKRQREMNKTENELHLILKAQYPDAKIRYEAVKLRLGVNCHYTPDFMISRLDQPILFVEAKGAHYWDDSMVKFKTAKEQYPEFDFQMFQKKRGEWRQIG